MADPACEWHKADFFSTASVKESVTVTLFLFFLGYTSLVFLREKNSENAGGVKLYRLVNELAVAHLFYFVAAILVHVLVPKRFPALLLFVYAIMLGVETAGTRLEKDILVKTAFWV
mmetsp:Transcript_32240/g.49339  ORF Transcript_32240/g.49339 Transcript_32240/m.49339 type:complete len:116 (-) Transcript_32240:140-487(-)